MSVPSITSGLNISPGVQAFTPQPALTPRAAPAKSPSNAAQPPSMAELQEAVSNVQEIIKPVAQDLLFSIDKDSGKTIVRIVDSATDEIIRQIPSEELIAIAKALDKLQGLLVKQKA